MKSVFQKYFELAFWIGSLILLAFIDPSTDTHYSFCIFKFLGIHFCPGCGIGHSISYLFHGDIRGSLSAHPLGIFALGILLYRIYTLSLFHFLSIQKNNHHGIRQQS